MNLGIDVGGTSIKAAVVDDDGVFKSERIETPTPQPAIPRTVGAALQRINGRFQIEGRVGVAFPAPIINSTIHASANISDQWTGMNGDDFFQGLLDRSVALINDADASGLAESRWGAAREVDGLVVLMTLGTGIGSAILCGGQLIPNTELGLTPFQGSDFEQYAAPSVMSRDGIDEKAWAERFNEILTVIELIHHPDLIVVSGGITARWSEIEDLVASGVPLVPARFRDDSGIIGASIAALSREGPNQEPLLGVEPGKDHRQPPK